MWSSAHGSITSPALLLGGSSGEAVPLLCSLRQALTLGQVRRSKVGKTGAGTPVGKLQAPPHLKAGKCAGAGVRVSVLGPGFLLCEMWRETSCLQRAELKTLCFSVSRRCFRAKLRGNGQIVVLLWLLYGQSLGWEGSLVFLSPTFCSKQGLPQGLCSADPCRSPRAEITPQTGPRLSLSLLFWGSLGADL